MQHDSLQSMFPASDQLVNVADWTALLDAIGTGEFERAFQHVLCTLAMSTGCVTFCHDLLPEPVSGCGRAASGGNPLACTCVDYSGQPHWIHFDDGPWRGAVAIGLRKPLEWA